MAARKQLSRPQKRYVPQQESYKNLPGIRPDASPVEAGVMGPQLDPSAQKLRGIAEGLASGSKALQDFFTMEKSFEATNMAANKARGLMGLEPISGPGHLDYGVDVGHRMGKGKAEALSLKPLLKAALQENNWFVDEENPDPKVAAKKVHDFTQAFIQQQLGESYTDAAFMEGAAEVLAAAKVEALVLSTEESLKARSRKQIVTAQLGIRSVIGDLTIDELMDPQLLRERLSDLTKNSAELYGINRDAMSELVVMTIEQDLLENFTQAEVNGDVGIMRVLVEHGRAMGQAFSKTDSAKVPFGGMFKDSAGNIKNPLASTIRAYKTTVGKMITSLRATEKDALEKQRNTIKNEGYQMYYSGEKSAHEIREYFMEHLSGDPQGLRESLDHIDRLERQDVSSLQSSSPLFSKLWDDPKLTKARLNRLRDSLTRGHYKELYQKLDQEETTRARIISNQYRMQSAINQNLRATEAEVKRQNQQFIEGLLRDSTFRKDLSREAERELIRVSKLPIPVDMDRVDAIVQGMNLRTEVAEESSKEQAKGYAEHAKSVSSKDRTILNKLQSAGISYDDPFVLKLVELGQVREDLGILFQLEAALDPKSKKIRSELLSRGIDSGLITPENQGMWEKRLQAADIQLDRKLNNVELDTLSVEDALAARRQAIFEYLQAFPLSEHDRKALIERLVE